MAEEDANCTRKDKRELVVMLAMMKGEIAELQKRMDEKVSKDEFGYIKYIVWAYSAAAVVGGLGLFFQMVAKNVGAN